MRGLLCGRWRAWGFGKTTSKLQGSNLASAMMIRVQGSESTLYDQLVHQERPRVQLRVSCVWVVSALLSWWSW